MPVCPAGHDSVADDYCDVCGDRIGGSSASPVPPTRELPAGGPPCPDCGTPSTGRFCEDCGYDFELGSSGSGRPVPVPDPTAAPEAEAAPEAKAAPEEVAPEAEAVAKAEAAPDAGEAPAAEAMPEARAASTAEAEPHSGKLWSAVVTADRLYYETVIAQGGPDADAIAFPPYAPERRVPLTGKEIRIGRRSQSRGVTPEIDLREPPEDPGVSHIHAVLLAKDDGTWVLVDPGSTNGTTLNDAEDPIDVNVEVPVKEGDRIYVGAWTAITLEIS